MELKDYSEEELKTELKRRIQERKKQKELEYYPRCKDCEHFNTITTWGDKPSELLKLIAGGKCCPFKKVKSGKRYRVLSPYNKICENFKKK